MSQVDYAYHLRRADEERLLADRAGTPEAKAAHKQLHDLHRVRAGTPVDRPGIAAQAMAHG